MHQHFCSHFVMCLFGAFCLFRMSSAAAIGKLPITADSIQERMIQLTAGKEGNTDLLLDMFKARQFVHGNEHKPDVLARSKRSGNDLEDLDRDTELSFEDMDTESAEYNRNGVTSELDRAIETYVARFYSDLLELIHSEMKVKVPEKPKHSNQGHKKRRRKTRPKRSSGSFVIPKNSGLRW